MLPVSLAAPLREALIAADFTYDAVSELLGPTAHEALGRNETTPGLRRTRSDEPLATLVRLFLLQASVPTEAAERALPGLVDRLAAAGVLTQSVGEVAARLDVRPYASEQGDLWVLSDLTPGLNGVATRVTGDYVLGISPASSSLAQLTLRHDVGSALDLGTGCGVQALHLATHADRVVATDVNARALAIARFNAALNDVDDKVEVRDGSFWGPVAGERFDLIATNPPFVISPASGERLVYRDSGLPGDQVVEHIVRGAADHLTDGGWCQVLANWVIETGTPWDERLAGWLPEECDAFVVQREVLEPASYVELWLKDSGHHPATGGDPATYAERYDTWLSWLESEGVAGIGFGWINLRRRAGVAPEGLVREMLEWPYDVEQPIAPTIGAWADSALAARDLTAETHLRLREDVVQETTGPAGAEDPATIVLRQQRGFRRAEQVDTVLAAVVGACDGDLSAGVLLDAVAQLLERDAAQLRTSYLPQLGDLVARGFLEPVPAPA
ncbi:class I SAM-dependent methyltransferase [Nocardioides sp. zg-536]|uniref:Class I SAM-dependent methyltransferase n=1 Tax=Nocardioides faecalis TaxID=2803858 RepID=A0A939BWL1_9ACTN|nr:class I SAM-dependent methyltransferase [Nocardioides faecalis]MBM9461156.1 class I SAM-dependent methyltransferase [Nocardioides faecalis]QVI59008.1 class I SAM-dependent methyltransferase [Nocardioides faecalis]